MLKRNTIRPVVAVRPLKAGIFFTLFCALALAIACKSEQSSNSNAASSNSPATSSVPGGTSTPASGVQFEGEIAMKMETPGAPRGGSVEATYYIKGNQMRTEMNMPGTPMQVVTIMDMQASKMTMLMPQQKMYRTIDMKETAEEMKKMAGKDSDEQHKVRKLTATGRQETIAGYPCEHWLMGEGNQEVDMCVAKGLGYFMGGHGTGLMEKLMFSPQMAAEMKNNPDWARFLEGGVFPLKVTMSEGGQSKASMEATRIEPKKLDDALFTVPPDYREMKAPTMPGMPNMPNVPRPPNQ